MTKNELIESVAKTAQLSKKDADAAVNAVLDNITATLVSNEKVVLVGFGTFEVRERKARIGRNPATKEEIEIPASKAPVFKAGKGLKTAVNAD